MYKDEGGFVFTLRNVRYQMAQKMADFTLHAQGIMVVRDPLRIESRLLFAVLFTHDPRPTPFTRDPRCLPATRTIYPRLATCVE